MADESPSRPEDRWPSYATREHSPVKRRLIRAMEELTGRRWLGERYDRALGSGDPGGFFGRILEELEVDVGLAHDRLSRIPREGPVLMIANHPFGLLDGLALCDIAHRTRGRFRILLHMGLLSDPRLEPFMLPVDMTKDDSARDTNRQTVKRAFEELEQGGTLLIFPAGGIATRTKVGRPPEDLQWHPMVGRLFRAQHPAVVPVHFRGRNSELFQTVSIFSMTLRASVLMRELRRMRGRTLEVEIGHPITWSEEPWDALSNEDVTLRLREAVEAVGSD